jgi:pimeloyl-ACP methyl ester carboxylesterase
MRFTLDQLEKLSQNGRGDFRRRLDLQRVGAFGHSLGGAASLQAAKDDSHVKAAIDIDGGLWGDVASTGLSKPFLVFRTDSAGAMHLDVLLRSGNPGYLLTLAGATHMFSSDLWLMPLVRNSMKDQMGSIDPVRALAITKAYIAAFFGEHLEGTKSSLLEGPSPDYPEVRFDMELGNAAGHRGEKPQL